MSRTARRSPLHCSAVGPLREALQVDLVGRQDRAEVAERLLADRAVRDDDRLEPRLPRGDRDVEDVLGKDGRLGVGAGDDGGPRRTAREATSSGVSVEAGTSSGRAWEISQFWHQRQWKLQPAVPRREGRGAGEDVEERLLLDRVEPERRGVRVDERLQRPAPVLADAAVPAPPLGDPAAAKAEPARDPRIRESRPPPGGMRRPTRPGPERREPGGGGRVLGPRCLRAGEPPRRRRARRAQGRDEEFAARLHLNAAAPRGRPAP